ncbi:MAG: hypothetical protein A2748_00505 [Candidatus Wildermuthbacteria bacterium RIFCSPHIGHO2_01_FULL_45_20]|uniref:inosine/xanthosine triphosphatase n=1 Tax=Candidatus Wildermuthbacteria bacterium RIFCSPHIGHO2_02_FULL_45_25 TaxID=1802450 RepID=A0A1G2R4B5_9BACT|nr:MAG: hypothetical protein A2748_00505 [Candidatus Wildermuthbacteria bacterium RIFCSPHIGHO2_01_FULL_45_20]OHA67663.1 MAG: hypothetical protein A3C04_01965 [Candidatus Wildermuthbacteria bacterium RIFCSPHIGHO2_02_FULL_45_25]
MKKIAIGSQNPVKISAVQNAFGALWKGEEFLFEGISVASGVAEQPMSVQETLQGAKTRASLAQEQSKGDFGVGLEGGIWEIDGQFFTGAWAVVISDEGVMGMASSIHAPLGKKFLDLIRQGYELGKAGDIITGRTNLKHQEGYFGVISGNALTRERQYTDAVIAALARMKYPELME